MALKGEGDPRWIVEEREDGKNLNAWHWEERNLLPWIKSRLPHFLVSECHRGADEKDVLSIVKIGTVKGEASSQQRKGRRFCLYELEIKMDWELRRTPEADVVKGEVHLPYVADENDKDEFEIQITTSSGPDQSKARDFAKPVLTKHLRKQMVAFLTEMLGEHTSATEMKQLQQDQAAAALAAKEKLESQQRVASELSSGGETVHMEIKFPGVPPALIYETLLDVNRLRAFTQSEVSLERKVGSKFSLFSGNITGVIDQMVGAFVGGSLRSIHTGLHRSSVC
mmetsp:Transcript_12155/g.30788  ORF Transcript_12155/g.30788 Transcript_12155/m.30788 type:complete len:282 (-) Transcript_12155:823-1668(-)